jgi:hypothetical protein
VCANTHCYICVVHVYAPKQIDRSKKGEVDQYIRGEIQEKEEEGSKLRVSLSQGQRHSSISADRASLEGGGKGDA